MPTHRVDLVTDPGAVMDWQKAAQQYGQYGNQNYTYSTGTTLLDAPRGAMSYTAANLFNQTTG
jgi:hypothetical protein